MENKKLTRSNNRMLAGVCAGLADYFGWDVTVVRIIYSFARMYRPVVRHKFDGTVAVLAWELSSLCIRYIPIIAL